jgi:hypothetical protein
LWKTEKSISKKGSWHYFLGEHTLSKLNNIIQVCECKQGPFN